MDRTKAILALTIVGGIVGSDIITKRWALDALGHGYSVSGPFGAFPMTLAFNQGVAFGLPLPPVAGRWMIILLTFVVLWVLGSLYVRAERGDWLRLVSAPLVGAGAIGNLIDRIRWDQGVVDFIGPINLGFMHWPIFNVADMAITTGAILLGISLWREEVPASADAPRPVEEGGA